VVVDAESKENDEDHSQEWMELYARKKKGEKKNSKRVLTRAGIARDAWLVPPSTNFRGLRVTGHGGLLS
jgi:hypothetical protein